jgi:hypothetical protein
MCSLKTFLSSIFKTISWLAGWMTTLIPAHQRPVF